MAIHLHLLTAVFLASSSAVDVPPSVRDRISFDFGWKHRPGLHAGDVPLRPPKNADPGANPAEASVAFDDSAWSGVQLPHDGLITGSAPSLLACPGGCSGRSYIQRKVLWYRKTFRVPASWRGSAVWLDFEGSFRLTRVFFNGALVAEHDCGYTPFRVRLDNTSALRFGDGAPNLVSVFVDPDNGDEGGAERGSGWWYEGGGLYRHVWLTRAHRLHVRTTANLTNTETVTTLACRRLSPLTT